MAAGRLRLASLRWGSRAGRRCAGSAAHFGRDRMTNQQAYPAGLPPGTASIHARLGTGRQVRLSAGVSAPCHDPVGPTAASRLRPVAAVSAHAAAVHAAGRMLMPALGYAPPTAASPVSSHGPPEADRGGRPGTRHSRHCWARTPQALYEHPRGSSLCSCQVAGCSGCAGGHVGRCWPRGASSGAGSRFGRRGRIWLTSAVPEYDNS